jgi:hypothetical protein
MALGFGAAAAEYGPIRLTTVLVAEFSTINYLKHENAFRNDDNE